MRALAALGLLASLAAGPSAAGPGCDAEITVGEIAVCAEVADTPERRRQGLSGRLNLREGYGMWFPYENAGFHRFWMKDMHFDIDILWVRAGRIVDVSADAAHEVEGALPVYQPRAPADAVLEVPAGTAKRYGWGPGTAVRVSSTTPASETPSAPSSSDPAPPAPDLPAP